LKKISIINLINIIILEEEKLIKILNSLFIYLINIILLITNREGINQNWNGSKNKKINILIQLRDIEKEVEGSKIENRFVIMFRVKKFFC